MSAKVVIGAGYGDEGKGLMTDYFAAQHKNSIVVRFNGGAQAGHSVQLADGTRHVFKHFGSGMLSGAGTYLSANFIVSPMLYFQESEKLKHLCDRPNIYVNPTCLVTTPYDILINQAAEIARGDGRHGSCGVGINETVARSTAHPTYFRLTVEDVECERILRNKLMVIRDEWVPRRIAELGIKLGDLEKYLHNEAIMNAFIKDAGRFNGQAYLTGDSILQRYEHIVFEGAQGLMLDEDHEFFPHVTRSKTGIHNVLRIAKAARITDLDVTYVTRAYTTRHGAGPFPQENERDGKPKRFSDPTNVPNEYQGTLRFGLLDLDILKKTIYNDLADKDYSGVNVHPNFAVTCLDQYPTERCFFIKRGVTCFRTHRDLPQLLSEHLEFDKRYESWGPTRDTIQEHHYTGAHHGNTDQVHREASSRISGASAGC